MKDWCEGRCTLCGESCKALDDPDPRIAELEARVAELEEEVADDVECSAFEAKESAARRGATDFRLRDLLGSCWSHMWGPPLERLGGDIDILKGRVAELEAALVPVARQVTGRVDLIDDKHHAWLTVEEAHSPASGGDRPHDSSIGYVLQHHTKQQRRKWNMNIDEMTVGQLKEVTRLAASIGCAPKSATAPKAAKLEEKRVVLVVDRGWIFAGDQVATSDGYIKLTNAVHVFSWQSLGFAKMLEQWKDSKVDLRKVDDVEVPKDSVIFRVPVAEGWGIK